MESVWVSHAILLGDKVSATENYQFAFLAGGIVYRAHLSPEEFTVISRVVRRAVPDKDFTVKVIE